MTYDMSNYEAEVTREILEDYPVWNQIKEFIVHPTESHQLEYCQAIEKVYNKYDSLVAFLIMDDTVLTQYLRYQRIDGLFREGERICLCRSVACLRAVHHVMSNTQPTQFNFSHTMARLADEEALVRDSEFFGGIEYQDNPKFLPFKNALESLFNSDPSNQTRVNYMIQEYDYHNRYHNDYHSMYYDTDRMESLRPEQLDRINASVEALTERLTPQFNDLPVEDLYFIWDYLKAGNDTLAAAYGSETFQIGHFYFEPYLASQCGSLEAYHLIHTNLMDSSFLSIMTQLVQVPHESNPAMGIVADMLGSFF